MTELTAQVRTLLAPVDGAAVEDEEIRAALDRALRLARPRSRVEAAAVLVYRGPASTNAPRLEQLPLRRRPGLGGLPSVALAALALALHLPRRPGGATT